MNKFLGHEHFLFQVDNPKVPVKHPQHPSIEEVAKFLSDSGEDAEIVEGHRGKPERSILVRHPRNLQGLHQMAKDLGQKSALHSRNGQHAIHYHNGPEAGKIVRGQGTHFYKEQPYDNYTKINTVDGPMYFSHNLDHSAWEDAPAQPVQKSSQDLSKTEPKNTVKLEALRNMLENGDDAIEVDIPEHLVLQNSSWRWDQNES